MINFVWWEQLSPKKQGPGPRKPPDSLRKAELLARFPQSVPSHLAKNPNARLGGFQLLSSGETVLLRDELLPTDQSQKGDFPHKALDNWRLSQGS